jgi:hypothetical protein
VQTSMAANEAVDALQDELVALTCEEQKPSLFKKLPRCVLIALAQRYLTATQRAALAASERYAREELVTKGELVSSVWRVTWISQTAAVRMLSTVPPRAYAPLQWTSELVIIDSDTRGVAGSQITRYWKGLALLIANAPVLTVLRMRKPWRLSPLVFAAVARRPAMLLEVALLASDRLDDFGQSARRLVREERLTCLKMTCDGPWPFGGTWLDLLKQATLVELDLSENQTLVELPEAIATLDSLRVLRANRCFSLRRVVVLARGPPALEVLALNKAMHMQLPAQLACAASLVRLELAECSIASEGGIVQEMQLEGSIISYGEEAACEIIKGLPKLRRLRAHHVFFESLGRLDAREILAHPCFIPSAIEFKGAELGGPRLKKLRGYILSAVRTMSPCQKQDVLLALAALERALPESQLGDPSPGFANAARLANAALAREREVLEDFLVRLREALAGKPVPAAMERDRLAAAAAPRFTFRAPSPVVEVSPVKPFVFGASAAEERVVTPETHSDEPFVFGANR